MRKSHNTELIRTFFSETMPRIATNLERLVSTMEQNQQNQTQMIQDIVREGIEQVSATSAPTDIKEQIERMSKEDDKMLNHFFQIAKSGLNGKEQTELQRAFDDMTKKRRENFKGLIASLN
ncbi:hypothetical protein PP175_26445 (plasmid) [Aneurinibacillus sp. Ricciae_BoGa-3]|uniref:hypothetical protein n=1 Tax=Aneurinibacillus sp. Ricciae_BoGa-3 TaxID=3022697 RepID=UPI002340D08E|nr:hypothetical protein [Aneurinibacillus sp. Ricciae_BoGa-3]WCK57605.1 hypothetical protein PP175_26445 [Aneurinibacillus sp. Ricciae_BoGa-3]